MLARTTLTAFAVLILAGPASGVDFITQTRSVEVSVVETSNVWESPHIPPWDDPSSSSQQNFSDSVVAPDFGPFAETANIVLLGNSTAAQDSELEPGQIRASGSHFADPAIQSEFQLPWPMTQVVEEPVTSTRFSTTFEVAWEGTYWLTGHVATSGNFIAFTHAHIRLLGSGATVLAEATVDSDPSCQEYECMDVGPVLIDESGPLPAGTYTLEAEASGYAHPFYSTAIGDIAEPGGGEFDLVLTLAAPEVPVLPAWGLGVLAALLAGFAHRFRR